MKILKTVPIIIMAVSVTACTTARTTFSFAPIHVMTDYCKPIKLSFTEEEESQAQQQQQQRINKNKTCIKMATVGRAIRQVDIFIDVYRTAYTVSANGRQIFEVPSFISLLVGATAVALGGNNDAILIGGAASAAFNGGNDYYAPKQKATFYNNAMKALQCVNKTASNGTAEQIKLLEKADSTAESIADYNAVYHKIINTALSIESKLAENLLNAGNFTNAINRVNEYETAARNIMNADKMLEDARDARKEFSGLTGSEQKEQSSRLRADERKALLEVMQADLDQCVLIA